MNTSVLAYLALITLLLSLSMNMKSTIPRTKHIDLCQAVEGGKIDVFTQKGGTGHSAPSPPFCPEHEIILYANVTYYEWPEQNKEVTFQIFDPQQDFFILLGRTNISGISTVSFRLPSLESTKDILGTWRVMASVDIAEVVVADTLEFHLTWNLADVNQDLKVDIYDVILLCAAYTSTPSDPHWNPNCDIAEPYSVIDIHDVATMCMSYGEEYNP
ncbi:hypothetical protein KAU88_01605 [Candidatus Bathyarchaeota archaeon]|nr:hypothetical protein [Candidatus Bathyarchaeota archaeon]